MIQLLEWLSYLDIFFFVFFVYDIVSYVLSPKTTYEKSHALTVVCKNRLNCYTYFLVKKNYRLPASRDKTRLCAAKILLSHRSKSLYPPETLFRGILWFRSRLRRRRRSPFVSALYLENRCTNHSQISHTSLVTYKLVTYRF